MTRFFKLNLFIFLFCTLIGASIGLYRVWIYSSPTNQLHILVLQAKDGAKLFDRPSSLQIIEMILHQKIQVSTVTTTEELRGKLLSAQSNEFDLIYLDYKSFKAIDTDGLTGILSESFDDILTKDLLVNNSSEEVHFIPITWGDSNLLNHKNCTKENITLKKTIPKNPFFVEGFAVPQKLTPDKIQYISVKIKKMILHPGFQKILSLLPFGITIRDNFIIEELRSVISDDRKSSGLKLIPLSER